MVDALHEFCIGSFLGVRCLRRFVLFLNCLLLLGLSVKEVDTDNGNCQQEGAPQQPWEWSEERGGNELLTTEMEEEYLVKWVEIVAGILFLPSAARQQQIALRGDQW